MYRVRFYCSDRVLTFPLSERSYVIGSGEDADFHLDAPEVSRRHARLSREGTRFKIEDLGSRNGTYLQGEPVPPRGAELAPLVEVSLGPVTGWIEEVSTTDLEAALHLPMTPQQRPAASRTREATAPLTSLARSLAEPVLRLMRDGADLSSVARVGGGRLTDFLPRTEDALRIELHDAGELVPLFASGDTGDPPSRTATVRRADGSEVRAHWRLGGAEPPAVRLAVELLLLLLAVAERPHAKPPKGQSQPSRRTRLVGASRPMRQLLAYVNRLAPAPVNLLLLGDSGTGKELLAQEIHQRSLRSQGPFVALNCAALPRDLLEAELFGIEERVATGVAARPGRFELADGGTLFLDEVCDMSRETQAMMLRVLQEKRFYRLGGTEAREVDVRVLAATNRDVEREIEAGGFRSDLYYRLAGDVLRLPPLADRADDVPLLVHAFLERDSREMGRPVAGVSKKALDLLVRYPWPGNVRELENEVRRLVALAPHGGLIDAPLLSPAIRGGASARLPGDGLEATLAATERRLIEEALDAEGGNVAATARRLSVSRPGLYQRMARLGIEPRRDAEA